MGHSNAGSSLPGRLCDVHAIEREIAQVSPFTHPDCGASRAYLRERRKRRNSLLPVNQLPTEIICEILLDIRTRSKGLEWLPITQVCSLWRTVCMGLGALWTEISDANSLEWMTLALQRSGQTPVFIDLCHLHPGKIELAFDALPRCYALHVGGVRSQASAHFERLLAPAPCLEVLHLHYADVSPSGRAPRVPARLLACHTPQLKTLYVYGCAIDLGSPFFASLLNLQDIEISCVRGMARPSQEDFLSLLARSPSVRRLDLAQFVPRSFNSRCTLADLTELWVSEDSLETCLQFLQHVAIPRASDITVSVHAVSLEHESDCTLASALVSRLAACVKSRMPEDAILVAGLSFTSYSFSVDCHVVASASDLPYAPFSTPRRLARVSCRIAAGPGDRPLWSTMAPCMAVWFSPALCARAQKLRVTDEGRAGWLPPHPAAFWLPVLATMARVRFLTLEGAPGAVVLRLLAAPDGARALPALRELVLQRVDLSGGAPARALLARVLERRRGAVAALRLASCEGVCAALVQTLSAGGVDVQEDCW